VPQLPIHKPNVPELIGRDEARTIPAVDARPHRFHRIIVLSFAPKLPPDPVDHWFPRCAVFTQYAAIADVLKFESFAL
jgi:hypothetical protein